MKITFVVTFTISIIFLTSCGNAPTAVSSSNSSANGTSPTTTVAKDNSLVASGHSGNTPTQTKTNTASNSEKSAKDASSDSSSASPMSGGQGKAIDTSEFDAAIAKADKDLKTAPNDEAKKRALAEAYAKRAFALTESAQYKSALGDFRKSLKLDPTNQEAKTMHDQILDIYKSMNREPPKEGEEPPPLPFKKS